MLIFQDKIIARSINCYPGEQLLSRYTVPGSQVIASGNCSNEKILIGNKVLRNFTNSKYPVCTIKTGGFVLLDYGCELSGGVRIVTGMMPSCKVRLRFGESVAEACADPNMDHVIHDVILPLSLLSSTDFGNTGFRFVRLDVLEGNLELVNLCAIAEIHTFEQKGYFHCSDELLNRIFDTASRTVSLCIQDYILDGIKRDRLLWGGDMHPEVQAILHVFGAIAPIDHTIGELCNNTISGSFINGHTSYSLWMLMVIHELWYYSNDNEILNKYKWFIVETVNKYLPMIAEDGVVTLTGYVFLDWPSSGDPTGVQAGLHGLLSLALQRAKTMYKELGLDTYPIEKALDYLTLRVPAPGCNKGAAALQHLAKLADRTQELEKNPFSNITTFLGGYVLQAKDNRKALELVRKYWGGMLSMNATTFWEDFDLEWLKENPTKIDEMPIAGRKNIHADFGSYCYQGFRHSLCHGWASGPVSWCMQKILGITPLKPGFAEISFTPDLCGMEFAEGAVPTPYGVIKVKLQKGKEPQITLPSARQKIQTESMCQ